MISTTLSVQTSSRMEFIDITSSVGSEVARCSFTEGLCFLFNPHTTAGLTINEGADPAVRGDMIAGLRSMVPMDHPFEHAEGNSPAHIMASLTGSSVSIAVIDGALQLGTWQKVFFGEFDGPRRRTVHLHLIAS